MTLRGYSGAGTPLRKLAAAGGAILVCLLALVLAWQIVAVAQATRLAKERPAAALKWRPGHAGALARLAEAGLGTGGVVSTGETSESLAQRALVAGPLQVTAIRVLGMVAERRGDNARALALMTLAGMRSQRDAATQLWLFQNRLRARDYDAAYAHGDTLMRNPSTRRRVAVEMALSAGADPKAERALVSRLTYSPPWRVNLVEQIATIQGPNLLLSILLDLKDAGSVVTEAEAAAVAQRFLTEGDAQQAYLAWVLLLPEAGFSDLANVYDGGFERLPGKGPFAWDFDRKGFAEVMQAPYRDGRALAVTHTGRARSLHASQTLVLAPGRYRLSVDAFMENAAPGSRLWWRIGCARGRTGDLAVLDPPATLRAWQTVSTDFVVPDADCAAQSLELWGSTDGAGDLVRGWFDRLRVELVPGPADRGAEHGP